MRRSRRYRGTSYRRIYLNSIVSNNKATSSFSLKGVLTFLNKNLIALLAIVISLISAYNSIKTHRDTATQESIDNAYGTFYDINIHNINNSDLTHLYTMPESYDFVKTNIHLSLSPIDSVKQAKYIIKERAFANYLFAIFEQVFYQYNQAKASNNKDQASFLLEILNYFTGRVLRNPRLLYLWDLDGGKLAIYYENSTIEYYNKMVLNDSDNPLIYPPDSIGPFYIEK